MTILNPRLNRLIRFYKGGRAVLAICILVSFVLVIFHPIFAIPGVFFLLMLFGNTVIGTQEGITHQYESALAQERQTQTQELQRIKGLYQDVQHQLKIAHETQPQLQRQEQQRLSEIQQQLVESQQLLKRFTAADQEVLEAQKRIEAQKLDGAIFHVTHWKAGSQWLRSIFEDLYPKDCIVPAEITNDEDLSKRFIKVGEVYTPVYGGADRFNHLQTETKIYRFFVMRDLRDMLVSTYFSVKHSHIVTDEKFVGARARLNHSSLEEGLLYLINENALVRMTASIQLSWLTLNDPVLRFEDLIANDVVEVSDLLLNRLKLPIDTPLLAQAIVKHRFQQKAQGRKPGEEDVNNHYRKGVAGDWQNYFTDRIRDSFKEKYGQVLIDTGYEKDTNW